LKRVYKVGNQEYVLLKVSSTSPHAAREAPPPKLKSERDYLQMICGQKQEDSSQVDMVSVG